MKRISAWTCAAVLGASSSWSFADTTLDYTGPMLFRTEGTLELPVQMSNVKATITLFDGALRPGGGVSSSHPDAHAGRLIKAAIVTDGVNTYRYEVAKAAYFAGDIHVELGRDGSVADWQIRFEGHYTEVALYGPDSVRPDDVAGVERCKAVDIVKVRSNRSDTFGQSFTASSCGVGVWRVTNRTEPVAQVKQTECDPPSGTDTFKSRTGFVGDGIACPRGARLVCVAEAPEMPAGSETMYSFGGVGYATADPEKPTCIPVKWMRYNCNYDTATNPGRGACSFVGPGPGLDGHGVHTVRGNPVRADPFVVDPLRPTGSVDVPFLKAIERNYQCIPKGASRDFHKC